jgi:hypothetical protein
MFVQLRLSLEKALGDLKKSKEASEVVHLPA